jgi:hypothetical protein
MEHSSFVDDRESDFGVEVSGTKRHQRIASSPSPSPFPSPLRNKKSRVDDMLDESQQEATCGEAGSSLLLDTSSSHGVAFPPRVDQVLDFGISYTPTQQHLLSSGNYFQPIENQPFNDGIEQIRYRHAKDSSNHIEAPTIDPLALYQPGRIAPLDSARNGSDQGSADPSQIHQKYSLQGLPIHPQFQQGVQWHPSTMHFSSLPYQLPETTRVPVQLGPGAQIQILIPQIGRPFSDRIHLLPGPMAGYQTAPSPRNISPGIPLSLNCDGDELSEYQILVRQQLEIFEASQEDVSSNTQGRKKQLVLGQAGIRCKHCSPFPLRQRGKGAIYYPTRLQGKSSNVLERQESRHLELFISRFFYSRSVPSFSKYGKKPSM